LLNSLWRRGRISRSDLKSSKPMSNSDRKSFLQRVFTVPIVDLGASEKQFAGVFTPEPELGAEKVGITEQFLENAEVYNSRYTHTDSYTELFQIGFKEAGYLPAPGSMILDIGSGAGTNTVMPCLRLIDSCVVVATDLSPNLLKILQTYAAESALSDQIYCVATDAMNNFFRPQSFDVVTGVAILHHLIDPVMALRAAFRVLKPGGVAFFFEPFEGCALVRVVFTFILAAAERMADPIDERVQKLLRAMMEDYRVRTGTDKSAPLYRQLDDKWLFTRRYFQLAAERAGFSSVSIVPQASHASQYCDFVQGLLNVTGLSEVGLPGWAWDMIKLFDTSLSPEMKWDIPLEGIIILKKD
jgi:ubiquinone/menaquinone biosynthesis C-methylase UbiE